jgi:hypothetical protein
MKKLLIACGLSLAVLTTCSAAFAQQPQHRTPPPSKVWRGDIRHFHEADWRVWRGGRWFHGPHFGRPGWWWVVGPTWYFYPSPVYPYPNPYIPPPSYLVTPPDDGVPPPPTSFWNFCASSNSYYPYVPTCPEGWQQVPAEPAQ